MEDQVCPRCRTTKYRNPSLKLLVNVCGHSLCESCVDLLFLKGSGSCPECQIPLRRSNFRLQLFEDPMVEKEVDIRRRVLRDYNKKEDDFQSVRDYNDYLEEIEEIIFNLVNGIEIVETNKRIEQYKKENKEVILKNKLRLGRTEQELEEMIEIEKEVESTRRLESIREEVEIKKKKLRAKEALIDELMFTEGNAKSIVKTFAATIKEAEDPSKPDPAQPPRAIHFSTGIKIGKAQEYSLLPKIEEGPLFVYGSPQLVFNGPREPNTGQLTDYASLLRAETPDEIAGGYDAKVSCLRSLQEAVAGLYYRHTA